jgi:hypothetical protein
MKNAFVCHVQLRVVAAQAVGRAPVRGDGLPIEHARRRKQEGTRTYAAGAL